MKLALRGLRLPLPRFTLEVDVELHGRVAGIFGASGAGKTSLLELIVGLRRPTAGTVHLEGRMLSDVAGRNFVPPERRRIAYVPQDGALFPHLSVRTNLLYGAPKGDRTGDRTGDGTRRLGEIATVLEIAPLLDRGIAGLSGGERQRVALGRALLAAPELLLLDEPFAGVDRPLRGRILPVLARIRDELRVPMLYVSHEPEEILALCDEALRLDRGRIVAHGTPAEVLAESAITL
ncbi:MAG TPA: ATP-binding cassette domain-containing protein [Thermoanaerobaculia bacterium]|nr:ATP-binding cassette domain-containing protein [Thermoanaerobaculia bacterium]